jgi:tetratricopeptide (TPR) repeat protein
VVPFALLAALTFVQSRDTVRVSATLTIDRIVPGESTVLEIRVETNGAVPESIRVPAMPPGVEILGSSDFSQTQINFPGGRNQTTGRDLVLTGRVPGTFEIPEITISVSRRVYKTRPVGFIVMTAPSGRAPPGTVERVRLRARAEPDTVWVGQQVMLRAEAEFPRELRQRQTRPATYQAPNPAGFWAQDVAEPLIITLRSVGSEIYEMQTFRRAYFPLLPGRHAFPPARLNYEFRPSLGAPAEAHELATDSIVLVVKPLPETGRPASFTGAVGQYHIEASLDPDRVAVGEAATLTVKVEGTGNIKALPGPSLADLPGLEVFPPTESADQSNDSDLMGGTKQFSWVVVPHQPGELRIPRIAYGYFDPEAGRYREALAQPITLEVTGAAAVTSPAIDLRPIRGRPGGDLLGFVRSVPFLALQLVPLLALLIVGRSVRRSKDPSPERRASRRITERFVTLREEALAADRGFWSRLADAVRASLADLTGDESLRTVSVEAFGATIESAGLPRATAAGLAELLDRLDRVRFAPGEVLPPDAPAVVDRAEQLVHAAMKTLGRSRARSGTRAALGLVLVPLLLSPPDPAFDRGIEAFRSANYLQAARAFSEHVEANPRDADGWYDAGNAWYMAGRSGQAVRAWIRAVRLQPRHRDARANLLAASPTAAAYIPPPLALNPTEAILGLSLIWWIAAGFIALRWPRRRPLAGVVLPAAIAGALILASGIAGNLRSGPTAVCIDANAAIRADPALKSDEIERLVPGRPVRVVDHREGWVRVRTGYGLEGWVEETYLSEV